MFRFIPPARRPIGVIGFELHRDVVLKRLPELAPPFPRGPAAEMVRTRLEILLIAGIISG
jgi:hypothetical protein